MSLLKVEHLRKAFNGLVAVNDVSFSVEAGEVLGLLGPNGAGKSTTMNMISGLLPPDGGTVTLQGKRLSPSDSKSRIILGVVPQDLAVYPNLTGRENLYFFGRLYGVERRVLAERIDEVLERTGLTGRAGDQVATYSGGMKRRLNFGAALLHRPQVLILDEPTVGVDPQSRFSLLECIRQLADDGLAAVYASHYMEEVQAICGRAAIMDHGRILACDRIEALLNQLSSELCLKIDRPSAQVVRRLEDLVEVHIVEPDAQDADPGTTLIISRDQQADEAKLSEVLGGVLAVLAECRVHLRAVETREPNLERLFLQLTGTSLRD